MAEALAGILCLTAPALSQTSLQSFAGGGVATADNYYVAGGAELTIVAPSIVYIPGCSVVRSIEDRRTLVSGHAVYSGIPVLETLDLFTQSRTTRYTLANRIEYLAPGDVRLAATATAAVEPSTITSSATYTYDPRPAPAGWDTTLAAGQQHTAWYVIGGPEVSCLVDGLRVGGGAILVNDFEQVHTVQPYVFLGSNPTRRVVFRSWLGGVIDGKFLFFARGTASWRVSPELAAAATFAYSRTSFVYNLEQRYLNFYREKDQLILGGLLVYDLTQSWKVFADMEYQRNSRFTMVTLAAGIAVRLQ